MACQSFTYILVLVRKKFFHYVFFIDLVSILICTLCMRQLFRRSFSDKLLSMLFNESIFIPNKYCSWLNIFDKMIVNFFKKLCNLQEKNLISMRGMRARNKRFMLDEIF